MTLRDPSYCEPPEVPIGLVCVLPPAVSQPIVGELLEPMVKGERIKVAIPVLTPTGLRWRRDEIAERDVEVVAS